MAASMADWSISVLNLPFSSANRDPLGSLNLGRDATTPTPPGQFFVVA
jgi:hypothetical protein